MYQLTVENKKTKQKINVAMFFENALKRHHYLAKGESCFTSEEFYNDKNKNLAFLTDSFYKTGYFQQIFDLYKKSTDGLYYYVGSKSLNSKEDSYFKTIFFDGLLYYVFHVRSVNFLLLNEEKTALKYPFEAYEYFEPNNTMDNTSLSVLPIDNKSCSSLPISVFDEKMIDIIRNKEGIDISPYIDFKRRQGSCVFNLDILSKWLYNFMQYYSSIPEYKKCIDLNYQEAFNWVKNLKPTVKKKSVRALTSLNSETKLPEYVRTLLGENTHRDEGLNIIELYKIGFNEENFRTFKKIFKSYNTLSYKRFMTLYNLLSENLDKKFDLIDSYFIIIRNNVKSFNNSLAFFFAELTRFCSNKVAIKNGLLKDIAIYVFEDRFATKRIEVNERLSNCLIKDIEKLFKQFPEIQEGNYKIQRINSITDSPYFVFSRIDIIYGHNTRRDDFNNILIPQEGELAFKYVSASTDETYYIKVDKNTQNIMILRNYQSRGGFNYAQCFYNKNKKLFSYDNDDKHLASVVSEIEEFMYDKIFPKFINEKIKMLCSI